jgi:hypothetical protein
MKTSMWVEKFHPITTSIGLVKAEPKAALENWLDWQRSILSQYGMGMEAAPMDGGIEEIIKSLLPLTAPVATRFAFIPTASPWSVYFDNSRLGTNAATTMPVLAERLGCETIRVVMVPPPPSSKPGSPGFRYQANILEVYSADRGTRRTIYAANDGGKWTFGQSGEPYPFEEIEAYSAKRKSDRFTSEMLTRYLGHLGLRPFDQNWYLPSRAWKVQKTGNLPTSLREY